MLILVFLLFCGLDLQISGATTDTLALGQSLPWNQTLVSKGGNFELGLFSPGKSRKHYMGIWFKKVPKAGSVYFPVHAAVRLHAGDVVGLLDERIAGDANVKELERVCKVACWCIQDEEGDRPTMGLVVQQLEGVADVGLPPIPSRLHMLAMVNEWVEADCSNNGSR